MGCQKDYVMRANEQRLAMQLFVIRDQDQQFRGDIQEPERMSLVDYERAGEQRESARFILRQDYSGDKGKNLIRTRRRDCCEADILLQKRRKLAGLVKTAY